MRVLFLGILLLQLKLNADCTHRGRKSLLLNSVHTFGAAETEVDAVPQHLLGTADKGLERGVGEIVLELAHGVYCVFNLLLAVIFVKGLLMLMWGFS